MSTTTVVVTLELALLVSCCLVIYCAYVIFSMKQQKEEQESNPLLADGHSEAKVDKLDQRAMALQRLEDDFARYRDKAKGVVDRAKGLSEENARLKGVLRQHEHTLLKRKRLIEQQQKYLQQLEQSASETPSSNVGETLPQPSQNKETANADTERLREQARQLKERLEQTLVEKAFIEQKFVELEADEKSGDTTQEELIRTRKELHMLEQHIIHSDPDHALPTLQ